MFKKLNQKGFTLIELLVVIAIIGILSTMAVVALTGANVKARDSKRQADLKVFQTAIEMYSTDIGNPPIIGTWAAVELLLAPYLPGGLPEDPYSTPRNWCYCNDTATGKYLVVTSLERNQSIASDVDTAWAAGLGVYALAECICSTGVPTALDCQDNTAGSVTTAATANTGVTAVCLGAT